MSTEEYIAIRIKNFLIAQLALWLPGIILMIPFLLNFSAPLVGEGKFIVDKYIGFTPTFVHSHKESFQALYETNPQDGYPGPGLEDISPWLKMWGTFTVITVMYYGSRLIGILKKQKQFELVHVLVFLSLGLIFGVELFFLKDIFHDTNAPYFRTNTVFKFYYHAWVIWGVASTWLVYKLITEIKKDFVGLLVPILAVFALLFFGSIIYIQKAVSDFYPLTIDDPQAILPKFATGLTMDGNAYIKREDTKKGDYEALVWISENISGQPIIAEAVGDSYTYYSRVSSNSGLITVMGWPNHEWQWRGVSGPAYERKGDIDNLYLTGDGQVAKGIIDKYQIEYIFLGALEYEKYPELQVEKFNEFADIVYWGENTWIYKVR